MPDGSLLFLGRKTDDKNESVDWWVADENGHEHATGALKLFIDRRLQPVSGRHFIRPEGWLASRDAALFSALRGDAINVWSLGVSPRGEMTTEPRLITMGTGIDVRPTAWADTNQESIVFSKVDVDYQLRRVSLKGG